MTVVSAPGRSSSRPPPTRRTTPLPGWAQWRSSVPYSVGIEEEVMILDPRRGTLAPEASAALADLPPALRDHVRGETHQAVAELATAPHRDARAAAAEARGLRDALGQHLARHDLLAAASATHPTAVWEEIRVSEAERYQLIHRTMRALARREPTLALHVHIGVDRPDRAITLANRLRPHLPLLLALSANSPFWQGRDTGLHSTRIPIFQSFPRVGIPRRFASYHAYVDAVDRLLRSGAIPEPTFLWWDVRLQPALGTVEVRIMDTQASPDATAALVGLTQAIAHLELEAGSDAGERRTAPEVLDENRFLAARDGIRAQLIDPETDRLVPAAELLARTGRRARPHAEQLGCAGAIDAALELSHETGAAWQRRVAAEAGLGGLLQALARRFTAR